MLRLVLLTMLLFLVWRVVRPYVLGARALSPAPEPKRLPEPSTDEPERIGGKLPHEVLGVPDGASQQVVHQAYLKLVREYHPDKTTHLASEIQKLAGERTSELNRAYEILSKRTKNAGER